MTTAPSFVHAAARVRPFELMYEYLDLRRDDVVPAALKELHKRLGAGAGRCEKAAVVGLCNLEHLPLEGRRGGFECFRSSRPGRHEDETDEGNYQPSRRLITA